MSNILGCMLVNGRPTGAPREACKYGTNVIPGHGGTSSSLPVPYLVISPLVVISLDKITLVSAIDPFLIRSW